jgi:cell division protein FtsW
MGNLIKKYAKGDPVIWGIIIILSIASLLSVYSATGFLAYKYQGGNTSYYMFKQMVSLGAGFMIIMIVHHIPQRIVSGIALLVLFISMGLLLITLFSGVNLNMASRWLTVPGIGITFQPSEVAKLALIIYVAKILAEHQKPDAPASEAFKPIIIYVLLVAGLIFRENLSTSLLVVMVSMAMMFVGRVPFKYLAGTGLVALTGVALVLLLASQVEFLPRAKTWSSRVEQFFNPAAADKSSTYQADQAKIAIASGGFFGKGPGNSVQRNFIPHPYSDFIYAIIAEEYGLVGALAILFCYLLLLGRVSVLVRASNRTFPAFLAFGLGLMLVSQAFVNMGVAVGIFPVTGQPLPLVSLGSTSVLFTCVAFGLILGVSKSNMEQNDPDSGKIQENISPQVEEQ